MNEIPTLAALAIIFAVHSGGDAQIGQHLSLGDQVPPSARGLLIASRGVVQIREATALRISDRLGWLVLERGGLRLVATGELGIEALAWRIEVEEGDALVELDQGGGLEVCVRRGRVSVSQRSDGEEDTAGTPLQVMPGRCLGLASGREPMESALEPERVVEHARALEAQRPPLADLPDLLGDLSTQVMEVEGEWAERLDQGPQREAQSCGCSEGGGSSGGFDPSGSSPPTPEPEQPSPGRLRVRISLPTPTP